MGDGASKASVPRAGVMAVQLDGRGRIDADLDCVGCGYNLRLCDAEGRCPECGLAVGRSSVGRYLCYHEPKWVRCLAWGMNRFAVALLAVLLTVVLGWVWNVVGGAITANRRPFWPIVLIYGVLPPVAIGFGVLGVVRATWPDPAPVEQSGRVTARRLGRVCLVAGCVLPFVGFGVVLLEAEFSSRGDLGWLSAGAWLLVALAWLGVAVFLLLHATKLARMIPRPRLARWTHMVLLSIGLSGLVLITLSGNWFGWLDAAVIVYEHLWTAYGGQQQVAYGYWSGWSPGDPWYFHDEFVEALDSARFWAALGLGVCLLGIVPLFFVYWSALHREAAKAKATWAASPWRGGRAGAGAEALPNS